MRLRAPRDYLQLCPSQTIHGLSPPELVSVSVNMSAVSVSQVAALQRAN